MGQAPVQLQGFNNLTKVVSFNLYDFFVAPHERDRRRYLERIDARYGAEQLSAELRRVAEVIDAEVLNVSEQDYVPHGASSLVLMSDVAHEPDPDPDPAAEGEPGAASPGRHGGSMAGPELVSMGGARSVGAHLTKSHLCAHTYPDWLDPRGICSLRLDIELATCGTIIPLRALDHMLRAFKADVVLIDYFVRGFTRDERGRRVYIDHTVASVQDFIDADLLDGYHARDLNLPQHQVWQTRLMRRELDPRDYYLEDRLPGDAQLESHLDALREEMSAVFESR